MKRIQALFEKQKAFVGYLTVGDGGKVRSYHAAKSLIEGGVNLLELGVPFSDPIADGPIIAMASQRALAQKINLLDVLNLAKKLRETTQIPLILFSYFNPLGNPLNPEIFRQIKAACIDGILIVDLPIEESSLYQKYCLAADLAPIYVITPATSDQRVKKIARHVKGFLYYACRFGTTGIKTDIPANLTNQIKRIKRLTPLPIVVGFGISTPAQVNTICEVSDGFVIGSLFVDAISQHASTQQLTQLAHQLVS